jgi:hypothetical protein
MPHRFESASGPCRLRIQCAPWTRRARRYTSPSLVIGKCGRCSPESARRGRSPRKQPTSRLLRIWPSSTVNTNVRAIKVPTPLRSAQVLGRLLGLLCTEVRNPHREITATSDAAGAISHPIFGGMAKRAYYKQRLSKLHLGEKIGAGRFGHRYHSERLNEPWNTQTCRPRSSAQLQSP